MAKIFNKYKEISPIKKIKILSLFSQPEFPENKGGLPKLDWLQNATGRVNAKNINFQSLFFAGNSG